VRPFEQRIVAAPPARALLDAAGDNADIAALLTKYRAHRGPVFAEHSGEIWVALFDHVAMFHACDTISGDDPPHETQRGVADRRRAPGRLVVGESGAVGGEPFIGGDDGFRLGVVGVAFSENGFRLFGVHAGDGGAAPPPQRARRILSALQHKTATSRVAAASAEPDSPARPRACQPPNLDALPATGALLIVSPLPIVGGSGSPASVLALMER
jgi:hypothetical protein